MKVQMIFDGWLVVLLVAQASCFQRTYSRIPHPFNPWPQYSERLHHSTLAVASAPPEKDATDLEAYNNSGNQNHNIVQTERFHQDMKRVLESRMERGLADVAEASIRERRHRPKVLDNDTDGVERVLSMLDRMVQMRLATEETFQIAMRACLQRRRLRWRNFNRHLAVPIESSSLGEDVSADSLPSPSTAESASSSASPSSSAQIICAADQLEFLLAQLQGITKDITLETYNLVLEAYATCSTPRGGRNYAKKADALLRRMETQGVFGEPQIDNLLQDEQAIPVETLAHVLHAWAWQQTNKKPGQCAQRANDYLDRIEKSLQDDNSKTDQNMALLQECCGWVLEAWSKSGSVGSAQRADAVFSRIKELALKNPQSPEIGQVLNADTYTNAILAWSKCKEPGSAERAHALLLEMLESYDKAELGESEPPLIAFNGAITAWARIGKPHKAEEVLWNLEKYRSKCKNLVPDVLSYNSVLHALVKSPKKKEALNKMQEVVKFMEENCSEQASISPDSFTYNALMKGWVRSGEANLAEQTESILIKMEQLWERGDNKVEPTNRHFNVVLNAYAKSSDPFAATKAYDLLQRMKGGSFRSKPDIITYTSVIESFSRSADPDASSKVIDLLEEAFTVHEQTGDPAMRPNLRTFTMVILTLANCNGSIVEARNLLTRLLELYEETKDEALMPNAYPYNYVLNCAANSLENKMQAFRIATQTYQEMRESAYVSPDSFTYAFWFKCCNNLINDKDLKTKCIFYAFEECRRDGLVSNTVLKRLQRGVPPKVLEEWLGIPVRKEGYFRDLKVSGVPQEWSRNAQ